MNTELPEEAAQYAWLIPYMPLLFTFAATVLFVKVTKVFFMQWLPLHIARLLTKGRVTTMTRGLRKSLNAGYAVMVGGLAAGYFIERSFTLFGMHGPQWRLMMALSIPLMAYIYIETFRERDGVLGNIARWLSAGEVNLTREQELVESLESASDATVFRALNAAGFDAEKFAASKRKKK